MGVVASVVCQSALRAKMLDDRARSFVAEHPDAVVDLGAGLDSAVFRVDPPPTVDWYSVDLPRVIALRDLRLVEETSLTGEREVDRFPGWIRISTRISGHIPAMARKARILRYRF